MSGTLAIDLIKALMSTPNLGPAQSEQEVLNMETALQKGLSPSVPTKDMGNTPLQGTGEIQPPIQAPIQPPIQPPIQAPIQPPIQPPIQAPIQPQIDQGMAALLEALMGSQDPRQQQPQQTQREPFDSSKLMELFNQPSQQPVVQEDKPTDLLGFIGDAITKGLSVDSQTGEVGGLMNLLRVNAANDAPGASSIIEQDIKEKKKKVSDKKESEAALAKEKRKFIADMLAANTKSKADLDRITETLRLQEQKEINVEKAKKEITPKKAEKLTSVSQLSSGAMNLYNEVLARSTSPMKIQARLDDIRILTAEGLEKIGISEAERIFILDRIERGGNVLNDTIDVGVLNG